MRPFLITFGTLALVAVLVVGLVQASGGDGDDAPVAPFDLGAARQQLRGAPAELAVLHAQANALLGRDAFQPALDAVKGYPVVVNKWASWCGPCRAEFPLFQQAATQRGKQVAFVGLNAGDNRGDATDFLRDHPVPFPSYEDPDEKLARTVKAAKVFPITVFIGRDGEVAYVHQGQYRSKQDLDADLARYAR